MLVVVVIGALVDIQ